MFTESPTLLAWGAVLSLLLVAGCVSDLRTRQIPNALVVVIMAGGVLFTLSSGSVSAVLSRSAAGLAVGFAIWIGFYLAGVIGAGDVKFFAAAGAWLGPGATWRAALIAGLVGGLLAVGFLLRERRLGATLRRFVLGASSRSIAVLGAADSPSPQHGPLPYGVALAVGVLAVAWIPSWLSVGR